MVKGKVHHARPNISKNTLFSDFLVGKRTPCRGKSFKVTPFKGIPLNA